jgi:hypothetical protein
LGEVQVLLYLGNAYEFPALYVAWVASCMNRARNHVILYIHSKGSSPLPSNNMSARSRAEMTLYFEIVFPWRDILEATRDFDADTVSYAHAGPFPWFNFWWARASFVATREEVWPSPRRHYFEDWLSRPSAVKGECPSAMPDNILRYLNASTRLEVEQLDSPNSNYNFFTLERCRNNEPGESHSPTEASTALSTRSNYLFPLAGYRSRSHSRQRAADI